MYVRVSVRPSDKWLVGPSSTSNRATCFFYFTWRYRALLRSYGVQGRYIGPETRALLAAILWCHGSQFIVPREIAEHFGALLALKLSRCM